MYQIFSGSNSAKTEKTFKHQLSGQVFSDPIRQYQIDEYLIFFMCLLNRSPYSSDRVIVFGGDQKLIVHGD